MPFMTIAGRLPTELSQKLNDAINESLDKGMDPDVAAGIALAICVDLYRANFGDLQCRRFVKDVSRRRLAHPPAHWGITTGKDHLNG